MIVSVNSTISSVAQSCLTLQPRGLQHARLPCSSPTLRACSNSCPSSQWCHPTILSSVVPFPSCLQSFPALRSFPRSEFFASGGHSIGVSASALVFPMNIQDWFPLGLTGLIHYKNSRSIIHMDKEKRSRGIGRWMNPPKFGVIDTQQTSGNWLQNWQSRILKSWRRDKKSQTNLPIKPNK